MDDAHYMERLKLFFEGSKHVSTLSIATLVLLFAIGGRGGGSAVSTGPALTFFGLSLLISLFGVFLGAATENTARMYFGTPGKWCFVISSLLFLTGVLFTIVIPVLT